MAVRPPPTGQRPTGERASWRVLHGYLRSHRAITAILLLMTGLVRVNADAV